MKKITIFSIFFLLLSSSLFATNIRVIDLESLIDNNKNFILFISEINKDQQAHTENFTIAEKDLKSDLANLDDLKLILDESEINKRLSEYNNKLNNFNIAIQKFNIHYENQIKIVRNLILKEILEILKNYSLDNQIDLILDSNNYILSNNSINITNYIEQQLNKIDLDISFEKYK